jgi:hypothetical protein
MPKTIQLLPRAKASAVLVDTAVRVTFKALAAKPQLIAFSDWLYAQGYCLGVVSAEAQPPLLAAFDEARNPVVGNVEFFRPDYAIQFVLSKALERGLPVEAMKEHLAQLVEKLYAGGAVFGFATEPVREKAIQALENNAVILTIKETVNATVEVGGSAGVASGTADSREQPAAGAASGTTAGGN